ncbi:unnamed protein product [Miscanthus lutarioriparius]|uniref:SEC12-like protein 1 n=1 Tax=Miscanthus lutarioriparius TaxID=422564 RepID=A0A811QH30_9POAL|nr:unnamed protein product [Miscanthus lutarioriparius]
MPGADSVPAACTATSPLLRARVVALRGWEAVLLPALASRRQAATRCSVPTHHGGGDGHLRIFHWPSMNVLLDEPKAHKSFRDMDISLDSEFLVSTSTDGSARIWKIDEGAPLVNLTRSSDEKIECCRFSRDGMKPFLFCTVAKGSKVVTVVWSVFIGRELGTKDFWESLSPHFQGSNDGDFCAVDVKKMEVSHWSKKVHLGSSVTSIEFCPTERG